MLTLSVAAVQERSSCDRLIGVAAGEPGVEGGVTSATVPVTKFELNSAARVSLPLDETVASTRSACVVEAAIAEGKTRVAVVASPFQVMLMTRRQVAKLSVLNSTEPVQVPGPAYALTVLVFMLRLNVSVIVVFVATLVAPEAGKTDVTANCPASLPDARLSFQKSP